MGAVECPAFHTPKAMRTTRPPAQPIPCAQTNSSFSVYRSKPGATNSCGDASFCASENSVGTLSGSCAGGRKKLVSLSAGSALGGVSDSRPYLKYLFKLKA